MPSSDHIEDELTPIEEVEEPTPTPSEDDDDVEGYDFGDLMGGAFDPMVTFGQYVTTQNGETIPDLLQKINDTLNTLTKVLHKISKTLDK